MSDGNLKTEKNYYYNDGSKSYEYHYLNGLLHNVDGPVVIFYYPNRIKSSEYYCLNNLYYDKNTYLSKI